MNSYKRLFGMLLVGSVLLLSGCAPSAHEWADFAVSIPLGVSRPEVFRRIVVAYGKRIPRGEKAFPELFGDPHVLDIGSILLLRSMRDDCRKAESFVRVYPPDLLEKMQPGDSGCMTGYVFSPNSIVEFYFDKHMKYKGFMASSEEHVGK